MIGKCRKIKILNDKYWICKKEKKIEIRISIKLVCTLLFIRIKWIFLVISNNRITILIREDKEDKERKKEQRKREHLYDGNEETWQWKERVYWSKYGKNSE